MIENINTPETISILLATYNPNIEWFISQLKSINAQDYPSLELIVLDDCSTKVSFENLKECIKCCITNFQFHVFQNEKNLGSTKTFEKLTQMSTGKYVSYCDQDDIWESSKLTNSLSALKEKQAVLVCGDVTVVNGEGEITYTSISKTRKRHIFFEGNGLGKSLILRNFVIGCTILMDGVLARAAVPFISNMVHDHWLAIFAADKGYIAVTKEKLMKYRIHGENQTGVLTGISTKNDYYLKRIFSFFNQVEEISSRINNPAADVSLWAKARVDYFNGNLKSGFTIFKLRQLNKSTSYFELCMKFMPNFVFKKILSSLQRGEI